jgi:PPOX class probable F420-dependent enzyme
VGGPGGSPTYDEWPMAEPTLYLFDGYNLLHAGDYEDPRELRDELASFVALKGARGVLVFDGHGRDETHGRLEVRYAQPADTLLERLAAEHRSREEVCLVSSDAAVRGTAGLAVQKRSSRSFVDELEYVVHSEERPARIEDRLAPGTRAALDELRRSRPQPKPTTDWLERARPLLDAPSPAVLATYRNDGSALLSPVWFRWSGDAFEIVIAEGDVKLRHLRRDRRCVLVVFEAEQPFRGVEVRGEAELVEGDVTPVRAEIAGRYLGAGQGARFAEQRRSKPGVVLRITPVAPRVWDLGDILPG